jgi:hypothetical protein
MDADNSEKPKSGSNTLATLAAVAAMFSAISAGTNAFVAYSQHQLARRQYTPQVALALSVPGTRLKQDRVDARILLKNVGPITIYDANVKFGAVIVPIEETLAVFDHLDASYESLTIGPTELKYLDFASGVPREAIETMIKGNLLVIGAKVAFTDELGREHIRFFCQMGIPNGDRFNFAYCKTPKQF